MRTPEAQHALDQDLIWQVENGHIVIARQLLERGANPNAVCERRDAPAITFCTFRSNSYQPNAMLELLLQYGANPDVRYAGEPFLCAAVDWNDLGTVRQLLMAGASPFVSNRAGQTPLKIAVTGNYTGAMSLLSSALKKPRVSALEDVSREELFYPSDEGYTALDNPLTWRHFDEVMAQLETNEGTSLSKQELLALGGHADNYLARAAHYYAGLPIIRYLDARGEPIVISDLVNAGGKATGMLEGLMEHDHVKVLFTPERWLKRSFKELQSFYSALPQEAQSQVNNYRQLALILQRRELAQDATPGRVG